MAGLETIVRYKDSEGTVIEEKTLRGQFTNKFKRMSRAGHPIANTLIQPNGYSRALVLYKDLQSVQQFNLITGATISDLDAADIDTDFCLRQSASASSFIRYFNLPASVQSYSNGLGYAPFCFPMAAQYTANFVVSFTASDAERARGWFRVSDGGLTSNGHTCYHIMKKDNIYYLVTTPRITTSLSTCNLSIYTLGTLADTELYKIAAPFSTSYRTPRTVTCPSGYLPANGNFYTFPATFGEHCCYLLFKTSTPYVLRFWDPLNNTFITPDYTAPSTLQSLITAINTQTTSNLADIYNNANYTGRLTISINSSGVINNISNSTCYLWFDNSSSAFVLSSERSNFDNSTMNINKITNFMKPHYINRTITWNNTTYTYKQPSINYAGQPYFVSLADDFYIFSGIWFALSGETATSTSVPYVLQHFGFTENRTIIGLNHPADIWGYLTTDPIAKPANATKMDLIISYSNG